MPSGKITITETKTETTKRELDVVLPGSDAIQEVPVEEWPSPVTLAWLWNYMPYKVWVGLLVVIGVVFWGGYEAGQNDTINQVVDVIWSEDEDEEATAEPGKGRAP